MIRKIKQIKNFGIFKDFNWNGNLQDFDTKNIIYGWNYSGKTTLSRIFSSLKEKELHPKCDAGEFKIILGDNRKEYSQDNLADIDLNIEVFNSDYIRNNLKWDSEESVDAILFDLGENVSLRDEINRLAHNLERINGSEKITGIIEKFQPDIDEFMEFENSKFSKAAKTIKNDIFNSLIEFTKRHFDIVKAKFNQDYEKYIISDPKILAEVKQKSLASNDKSILPNFSFILEFEALREKVSIILRSAPSESEVIEILENNSDLYKWSQDGLEYHTSKNLNTCSFCGNNIEYSRIKKLNNYFSNQSAKFRKEIEDCKALINEEINSTNYLELPKSKNDLTDSCQEQFQSQLNLLNSKRKDYVNCLKELISELNRKESGNIFKLILLKKIDKDPVWDFETWLSSTAQIITTHNDIVSNFNSEQNIAREKLKDHQVALFLKEENYYSIKDKKEKSEKSLERYKCLAKNILKEIKALDGLLKSVVAGKDELNRFIKAFLNREDIIIEVTHEDKFLLKRGNSYAYNLSEGEKTAIAFAYFLVKLESLFKDGKLMDTIVFIDDPISSLDANHIAQVYSLINSFFFRKGIDSSKPEKVINCFKQLFISTHNSDFFSFLKDSSQINKRTKNADNTISNCQYYLIKRIEKDNSTILPIPKSIKLYKSEYVYLFEIIYNYYQSGCQESDSNFLLMPNALRRFLEIYTLMKLPHANIEFENRVTELVGNSHQLKFLNHFSHFTSFEKLTKFDDLLMNLPAAVEELIQLLEKDNSHFNSLKKAISKN